MSDFEDRLRDALGSGADDAPDAIGLADGARGRARTRRRTTTSVVVAVAVAAIAVPLGALALRDSGPDRSDVPVVDASDSSTPEPSTTPSVPAGYRTETWRDLEIQVPADWAYGPLSTWCISHDEPGEPFVQRPGGAVEMIACTPSNGYGVQFFDPAVFDAKHTPGEVHQTPEGSAQIYPEGSWVGHWGSDGDAAVLVVAPTEEIAQQILDSAHRVEGVDSNGCPPNAPKENSVVWNDDPDTMSVCRYGADGWLEQSELLTGQDAEDAQNALDAADKRDFDVGCPQLPGSESRFDQMVIMQGGQSQYAVGWSGEPSARTCWGVYVDGAVRGDLTADVMYWALSPGWSGGVDGGVPMPERLRSR